MKPFFAILLLLAWLPSSGQEIVAGLAGDTKQESFSVYLPKDYDAQRVYPVLFIFDPLGNGNAAIGHFIQVADTFGLILAASNETANGRHSENFDLASNMINVVLEQYPVLQNRMYLAGFSGGSRLASAIAVLSGQFEGVIGCGSGFSPNASEQPRDEAFSYIGIVGDEDMNWAEMHQDYNRLKAWRMDNSLITFSGPHQWPEASDLRLAFSWLEFRAQQKGLPSLWSTLQDGLFEQELEWLKANQTFPNVHVQKRVHRLSYMYPEQFKGDAWTQSDGQEILNDKKLNSNRKIQEFLIAIESEQIEQDNDRLLQFFLQPKAQYKSISGWIKERNIQLGLAGTQNYSLMYRRLLRNIYANLFEQGIGYGEISETDLERAFYSNELLLEIRQSKRNQLLQIELIARYQRPKKAVNKLEEYLTDGSIRVQDLSTSNIPDILGNRSDYQKLVQGY